MKSLAVILVCLLAPGLIQAGNFPVADFVVIEKDARKLHLLQGGEVFRTFGIALGLQPVGDKKQEGDFRTPEGRYILDRRNPNSEFFLSIGISYPDARDRREAAAMGVNPGGAIMPAMRPARRELRSYLGRDLWFSSRI